ncbi:hypothetical protein [Salinifilum ghardaiensis]
MDAWESINELRKNTTLPVHSNQTLSAKVSEQRNKENERRLKSNKIPIGDLPEFNPTTGTPESDAVTTPPVGLLHILARATALSSHDSSRVLARHWDCLRYVAALQAAPDGMTLSQDGNDKRFHRRRVQAEDLGTAFGIAAARKIMTQRHRGYRFDVVDADVALEAGWKLRNLSSDARELLSNRHKYFLVGHKARQPLLLASVECRGSHGQLDDQHLQLATGAPRLPLIAIGNDCTPLPGVVTSTALFPESGAIRTHALPTTGNPHIAPPEGSTKFGSPVDEGNIFPGIPYTDPAGKRDRRPGFHLTEGNREWFSHALARTAAASLLTFAGDRNAASKLLTKRQGGRLGSQHSRGSTGMSCDTPITLGGMEFEGTDHVFRFDGVRVEAFSGLEKILHRQLASQELASYEAALPAVLQQWRQQKSRIEQDWGGVIHMDPAGSVLAIRAQPGTESECTPLL